MEDWESEMCEDTKGSFSEKIKLSSGKLVEVIFRKIGWYNLNKLQSSLMKTDQKKKTVSIDSAEMQKQVLEYGLIKGPWPDGMKNAFILKLKGEYADKFYRLIAGKKQELQEDDVEKKL